MKSKVALSCLVVVALSVPSMGQYFESFDSAAADVTIMSQADTSHAFIDYSTLGLPEAPRSQAGDSPTRGIQMEANLMNGAGAAVNVIAGATPISMSGNYRASFDAYLSFGGTTGTTELLLWGVGTDNAPPVESRNQISVGTVGTWGWIAGENGFGTEDAAFMENATELADLGDTQLLEDGPFNAAFLCDANNEPTDALPDAPNGAPVFEWVQVDVDVLDNGDGTSNVTTYFNFVPFFTQSVATASATGFAMLGYEDPFGSINDAPELTWGVFDNFSLTQDPVGVPTGVIPTPGCVPEPSAAVLCLLGLAGLLRRR